MRESRGRAEVGGEGEREDERGRVGLQGALRDVEACHPPPPTQPSVLDAIAIHLKLNELVAAVEGASNRLISAEDLSEDEVKIIREHFRKLAELAKVEGEITCSHTIEEAEAGHARKKAARHAQRYLKRHKAENGAEKKPED